MATLASPAIPPSLDPQRELTTRAAGLGAIVLFAITAAVYWPACNNDFVNWDDNDYVCDRDEILAGINWKGIVWAATANVTDNWHPLTLLSLQLDAQLFGTGPRGFHRTSVLLHALNAALALLAIYALTGRPWRSLAVAVLFALHPMRVESVAWVSERKDLVSGLFFLLTILAYVWYVKMPSVWRYLIVALCLGLGLSAKPMLVTTPCVLFLLDYWPLNRFQQSSSSKRQSGVVRLVLEKIPLLGLSVLDSVITVGYQQTAIKPLSRFTPFERVANAADAIASYVVQTVWPVNLSPFYPLCPLSTARIGFAFGLVIVISGLAAWQFRTRPPLIVGWCWFVGMLVPVCGLIQVGNQARADRYTYLPHIGIFIGLVWTVAELVRHSKLGTRTALVLCTGYLISLITIIPEQIAVWHDTESIWRRAHQIDSTNGSIIDFWLTSLVDKGKLEEASRIANEAIEQCDETDANKMRMLIIFLLDLGENQNALRHLDRVLKHHSHDADLIVRKGRTLAAMGNWAEATEEFRRASRLVPSAVTYEFFLAHALANSNQGEKSKQVYSAATRQAPNWGDGAAEHAWRMATSWKSRDRRDPFWAVCLAEQAVGSTDKDSSHLLDVLAATYANAGRFDDAIRTATRAAEVAESSQNPGDAAGIRERLKQYEQHLPYRQAKPASLGTHAY